MVLIRVCLRGARGGRLCVISWLLCALLCLLCCRFVPPESPKCMRFILRLVRVRWLMHSLVPAARLITRVRLLRQMMRLGRKVSFSGLSSYIVIARPVVWWLVMWCYAASVRSVVEVFVSRPPLINEDMSLLVARGRRRPDGLRGLHLSCLR